MQSKKEEKEVEGRRKEVGGRRKKEKGRGKTRGKGVALEARSRAKKSSIV